MKNRPKPVYYFIALHPKHWIKNLLLFMPLIFGERLFLFSYNLRTVLAFFLFSAAASGVYLINDVMDAEKDKFHPVKRLRPVAAGKIPKSRALGLGLFLGFSSLLLSFWFDTSFGFLVLAYWIINVFYSKILKEKVIVDVFCLAVFFVLRILAGGVAAQVRLSHWIVAMTALLALFLGFGKRRQELRRLDHRAGFHRPVLGQYSLYFIDQMIAVVTSSIVVAYLFYTVDERTVAEFGSNGLLWSAPFVYYGIFRYLYVIHKTRQMGDPTRVLLKDRPLQLDIALWLAVCVAVIYGGAWF